MTVRMGKAAGDWARGQVGRDAWHLMCKAFVRTAFNVVPSTSNTAKECWAEAGSHRHFTTDPEAVPAYVFAYLNTSATAEHAVIPVGRDSHGYRLCVSTDAGPNRTVGLVRLASLADSWGPLVGWSEYMDGQRIWTPPPAGQKIATPKTPEVTVASRFEQIVSLANSIIADTTAGTPNSHAAYEIRATAHERL